MLLKIVFLLQINVTTIDGGVNRKTKSSGAIKRIYRLKRLNEHIMMLTFHPRFSKNVHIRDCPVVLPPHGPAIQGRQCKTVDTNILELIIYKLKAHKQIPYV